MNFTKFETINEDLEDEDDMKTTTKFAHYSGKKAIKKWRLPYEIFGNILLGVVQITITYSVVSKSAKKYKVIRKNSIPAKNIHREEKLVVSIVIAGRKKLLPHNKIARINIRVVMHC